jgi:di/tricarboxylate transporter
MAKKDFARKWYHSKDFSLVTSSFHTYSKPEKKGNLALALMLLMVIAAVLKITPMLIAAAVTAIIMILTNIISFSDAKNSVDYDVLIIIASALGIGQALLNSGLSDIIAEGIIGATRGFGVIGIIAGLYIVTNLYTEFITNNAGAAIMFPIAYSVSQNLEVNPMPFMLIIAIGASASFSTPIGYQTNLLVYNVGGYRFSDFFKSGIIMNLAAGVIATFMIYVLYFM